MKRLLVFLAVFVPAIALVYFLSGGTFRETPVEPLPPDEPIALEPFEAFESDEAESAIRLGGSPTVRRLSAIDFDLRLYREVLDPVTHQRRFLRSVDFHGDRSESVTQRSIAIESPRITFHEILDAAKPKAEATRPMVTVTALRGTLEAVGADGLPRADQEYDLCRLEGDVRITFLAEGTVLKTTSLDCFFDERIVRTADAVEVEHGAASLVGKGLVAAGLERTWTIERDATLVATDPATGEDSVIVAPNGFVFTGAGDPAEGSEEREPAADERGLPPIRGGTATTRGGVRLEQWSGRRGDGIEPRFEAEAERAEAVLEGLERPKGDAMGAVGRSLRSLKLGGGVSFSDSIGISGRGGSLTLDRDRDELTIADAAVIEIDARARKLPPALAAAPSSGEIRRLVLSARDAAVVSGLRSGAPASLRLRGAASLRPIGDRGPAGGGLSGEEIEIVFEPREKGAPDGESIAVREIVAFGGASLDLPGTGTLRGPEIRMGAASGSASEDALFEVIVPSRAELRIASDGFLAASLPGALRDDDSGKAGPAGEGYVIVRCEGPLEYLAPRPGSPGRLRLTHSVEVEEWSGGERQFRMSARNAEASLAAAETGAVAIASLSAQGRVAVDAPRGRLRARRLDFDGSDRKLACEGEPAELEIADAETGELAERLSAARLAYFGALGLVEAEGGVEATILDLARYERRRGEGGLDAETKKPGRDFRARLGGAASGGKPSGPATLRCGKLRALLAQSETGFEFEDLLAEIGVEVKSGDDVATGETLAVARRGATLTLSGRGERPARLDRPSPDAAERRETVTGPRILLEPGPGDAEVATLPDGGDIVLWRARSKDPFAVARIRDKAEAAKPPVQGIVRTAVTSDGPIRLETGKEIVFSAPVRIEQTDEAGALVSRIEGDHLRLDLAPDAAAEADAFVAATLTGHVRFETPQARGTGGLLHYDARKKRLFLQRGGAGEKSTLRFAKGLDLAGRLIEYDPETGEASLHDFDLDPR